MAAKDYKILTLDDDCENATGNYKARARSWFAGVDLRIPERSIRSNDDLATG